MSQFGISQNFRNAKLLGRFARTEHETKNKKPKIVVAEDDSSESSSASSSKSKKAKVVSQSQPSANKLSAVTARYVTKSADHL